MQKCDFGLKETLSNNFCKHQTFPSCRDYHLLTASQCVKSVCIQSFSGLYFPAFGLNTERYSVSLGIQSECGKIGTKKTPYMNTSYDYERRFKKPIKKFRCSFLRKYLTGFST